jgi:hypothetical protein
MRVFPFEVGYVSGMGEDEMLSLAQELEMGSWKDDERMIREAVESFMTNHYRCRPDPLNASFLLPVVAEPAIYADSPTPYVTATYKNLVVRVPDAVDPDVARRLAEMQIREQLYEGYDPRFPDND